ncbi:MAG: hypothetical protein DWQ05_18385 [Calditrichaeota bacterium]|nr:MAG: hypothetical protein DWQ05_18385 [Calditrichota bacterium]
MVKSKIKFGLLLAIVPIIINAQTLENSFQKQRIVAGANQEIQSEFSGQKSPGGGAVFFKSLLFPGWGQHALGAKKAKRNFLISEAILLGSAIGFSTYQDWLQDDYIAFASSHAQAEPAGKDAVFWADIGDYLSVYEYNESWLRRRSLDNLRDPDGGEFWEWDDLENAQKYREMRIDSDKAKTWSQFAVAGVITNHVVSALHALWLKRKQGKVASIQKNYVLAFRPVSRLKGGVLNLKVSF